MGITLAGADGIVEPADGPFQVGFTITPETDFTFSDENTLTPLSGTIEHTGSVTLALDTLEPDLTVGDFTIGFDADRVSEASSGFFVQDNLSLNAILFDITAPPSTVALDEDTLQLGSDLAISEEFAAVLATVDKPNLAGAVVGSAQIDADLAAESASVPEPGTAVALLLTSGAAIAQRVSRRV
ncbi:MAG: hypothetical protein AAFN18_12880 [Cyanobacteria bacterium J06554_6]